MPNAAYKPEVCIRTPLEAARSHGFPVERIVFEVSEAERVEDGPWLADFQPDIIKLDMALVRGVDGSRSRQAIARGLLRMGQELNITVIAEGIETAGERDLFSHEGVALMQGYLFGSPGFRALAAPPAVPWPPSLT